MGNQGFYMYSATGKRVIWAKPSVEKTSDGEGPGRGVCADISAAHRGAESWSGGAGIKGVYNCKGVSTGLSLPASTNFLSWWDGDLLRELLDKTSITKYGGGTLLNASGCASNNSTKSTPCLSGDILGDWREEVIFRTSDNTALRIYTTTIPTTHKLRTLLHDPQYRMALAWQNGAYNQPPHVSFYLGDGMADPPKPNITIVNDPIITQVDQDDAIEHLALYPNPSNTGFNIYLPENARVKILNQQGMLMEEFEHSGQLYFGESYASGIYHVEVSFQNKSKIFRLSKY